MIHHRDYTVDLIKISELLKLFNLDLNLSQSVLDIKVDSCFKSARLIKQDNYIKFEFEDYNIFIYPENSKPSIILSEEQDFRSTPLRIFYNNDGAIYKIN